MPYAQATRVLAPANKPLTLLALGITLSSTLGLKQLGPVPSSSSSSSFSSTSSSSSSSSTSSSSDVSNREKEKEKSSSFFPAYDYDSISILARRLAIPSLIGAVTFILQGTVLNSNLSLEPALYLAPMTAVTLALLSPLSSTVSQTKSPLPSICY